MAHHSSTDQAARYFNGRRHSATPTGPVQCPAAWRGSELRGQGDLRHHLSAAHIAEIERALARAARSGKPTIALTRDDFPLPGLGSLIDAWRRELSAGRGFALVAGVPVARWDPIDAERFFWCFGQYLGTPGLQNPQGDLLGHVIDTGDAAVDPLVRLYRTASNINYHCDGADVVGLLCLRTAPGGGTSRIASSVTIFNELWREDPDLALRLFKPVRFDRRNEQKPGQPPFIAIQPACFDGQRVRTFYHSDYYRSVTRHVGQLDADELALLDAYERIGERDDIRLEMQFEPGDIQLLSNHTVVHARTAYRDGPAGKRHLLRLWLSL
jgi:hypothetical protein